MIAQRASCQAKGCAKPAAISVRTVAMCEFHMAQVAERLSALNPPATSLRADSLLELLQRERPLASA